MGTAVLAIVGGGMMSMLWKTQEVRENAGSDAQAQQGGRMAMESIQRDLLNAGVGLSGLVAPFPPIEQRGDGGVRIRWNPNGRVERMRRTLQRGRTEVEMRDTSGFATEQYVLLSDSTGKFQLVGVREVRPDRLVLHDPANARYRRNRGASVMSLVQVQYWVDSSTGTPTLWRQIDRAAGQPVATDVQAFSLSYFDDSEPAQPFNPTDAAERLRIRGVDIALTLDAPRGRIADGRRSSHELRASAVPRAIFLTR